MFRYTREEEQDLPALVELQEVADNAHNMEDYMENNVENSAEDVDLQYSAEVDFGRQCGGLHGRH